MSIPTLIVDYDYNSLVVDYDPHGFYVPQLTPAFPGTAGPRGDDGWMVPIQHITTSDPALVLDYSLGKHIVLTLTQDVTSIDFEGWPPVDFLARMTIEVINAATYTIAWPSPPKLKWADGALGAVSTGECWRMITTRDAGATLRGHVLGNNFT